MSWASLILTLLKVVSALVSWTREKQMIQAGHDQAIAQAALEVLDRTATGKALRSRIITMSDADAEALWKRMTEQNG